MLSLLGNSNFWLMFLIFGVIVGLIILYIKFPFARVFINAFAIIITLCFTVYAGVYINKYYSASGGIYGQITSLFSSEIEVEELKITITNVEMTQENNTDIYSVSIYSKDRLIIDNEKEYNIYVNGKLCANQVVTADYVRADYTFVFFDGNDKILCADTLHLRFVLDENRSYLYVATNGGSKAVNYWNQYFNRNNFVVTLEEKRQKSDLSVVEGVNTDIYSVSYLYGDEVLYTKFYQKNTKLDLPDIVGIENWTMEENVLDENYSVNSNMVIQANFYDIDKVSSVSHIAVSSVREGKLLYSPTKYTGLVYYDNVTEKYHIVSSSGYGWKVNSNWNSNSYYIHSNYSEIMDYLFDVDTLKLYSLNIKMNDYYYYKDNFAPKLLYSKKDTAGLFVFDLNNQTSTQVFEYGKWQSVKSSTDSSVIVNMEFGHLSGIAIEYDFQSLGLDLNPDYDAKYGVYKTDTAFKIAYIDEYSNNHLYLYDIFADKVTAINKSYSWERKWLSYHGEEEIEFIRGYSASVAYVINFNFVTGKITNSSFDNDIVVAM